MEIYKLVSVADPNNFIVLDTAAVNAVCVQKLKEGKNLESFMKHYVLLDTALEMLGYQITVTKPKSN